MTGTGKKGTPKDRDKLIRQLSLVAFLMAISGRKVDARTIRDRVEGYDGSRNDEAFARRFFADRDDLSHQGIEIQSERSAAGEGDLYWLAPENIFLPPVPFSREELAALHTCLYLLEGQFAWSHLLRLALQSLALGTGNALDDPATGCLTVDLQTSGFDGEVARRQARIEQAIIDHKTVRFGYQSYGSDKSGERVVDPYAMLYTSGEWYVVGLSHERGAVRMFKLMRIRGRITNATKKEHDFSIPESFRVQDFIDVQPWQLGPVKGTAEVEFSPLFGWWAQNNLAGCGEFELHTDGSATLRTEYADGDRLCSLALQKSADTRVDAPKELRARMREILNEVARLHKGAASEPAPQARPGKPGRHAGHGAEENPQVEPDRLSQLARTVSYLVEKLGDEEFVTLPVGQVCLDLGFERDDLDQAMSALYLVSADSGGYLVNGVLDGDSLRVEGFPHGELLKRPARLTPREARAMMLAIDLIGTQTLAGLYPSLETAKEKIVKAAGGLGDTGAIPVGELDKGDIEISQAINEGLSSHRLVEIEYLSRDSGGVETRQIEPYLVNGTKGQWYLVAWCRMRDGIRTFRFEMIRSARVLDETFEPRDIDLAQYRRDPRQPSGTEAPAKARVLFSPAVARLVHEKQPDTQLLEDGSLLGEIPYFQEEWLVDEVLGFCGQAELISPEPARKRVRETALRLLKDYSS